uniref:SUN domain-containing protein n=1 Tax=Amazona collaria TaxID=241587 RepID=A0A8B9G502_9PSIT
MTRPQHLQVSSALVLAAKSLGVTSESCTVPEAWQNGPSVWRNAGCPALHPREVVPRTWCLPPCREPKHSWLSALEKRPQESGLAFLWFLCPGSVFSLVCHLAGTLASLWRYLLITCVFTVQKMAVHKKRCLKFVVFLLPVVLGGVYCGTSLPVWTMWAKAQREDLTLTSAAETKMLRNLHTFLTEHSQMLQFLLEEVAQLRVEISSLKKEEQGLNQAALELASEIYFGRSDWALKTSGATIDMQRTSKTYNCKENWVCRVLEFFCTPKPPDTILQPDVSPGNCWPLQGQQGQVVIRLPARVHLTAVSVQHISKEVSPSGTVISAPRDIAVFDTSWGLEVPS